MAFMNYPLGYYNQPGQPALRGLPRAGIQQKIRNQQMGGMPLLSRNQRRRLNLQMRVQQETLMQA